MTPPARPSTRRRSCWGWVTPGGPAVSRLAQFGVADAVRLPRPMLSSGDLDFSFSGLKTAVLTAVRKQSNLCEQGRADIARAFVEAIVDVLAIKTRRALDATGLDRLVVAGGVGANAQLRERLQADAIRHGTEVFFPAAQPVHRQRRDDCARRPGRAASY